MAACHKFKLEDHVMTDVGLTKVLCFRVQSASLSAEGEASSLTLGTPFWDTLAHARH